ncbi:MAG: hypothetical protein E7391_08125 [Ruminococcaceae bacterium]|nr:hypothetical protein [Oscillospiraceae bacterium]
MDFFHEYIVKRKVGIIEWLLSILIILAAFLIVGLTIRWAYIGIVAVFDAAVFYFAYVLISRFSIEYEYTLTNSELDIDKIYAKRKRTKILTLDVKEIEIMAPIGYETEIKFDRVIDCSTKDLSNAYFCIYTDNGSRIKFIFNPPQKMIDSIKTFSPSKVK